MKSSIPLLIFCFSLFDSQIANAFALANVFSNNMVLQQQQVVPVWGKAHAGNNVVVSFLKQKITTVADKDGEWFVELSPLKASYIPEKLEVVITGEGTKEKVIIDNVLVGEVWLSSGQSNMRFTLAKSQGGNEAVVQANNNKLRLLDFTNKKFYPTKKVFNVKDLEQLRPDNYFKSQGWQVSNAKSSKNFSAVAYHFAQKLQQQLDVPVGIINVAIGGSLMENFISHEKLASIKTLARLNDYWIDNIPQWCAGRAKHNLSAWFKEYPGTLPNHPFKPSFLFEAGIKPLVPFAIKGAIWYQGESNAPIYHSTTQHSASSYQGEYLLELSKLKFKALISDWREQWQKNDLPFYFVQLPGLNRPWAPFRQMQFEIANEVSNTGMAITYDLGHPTDVHPNNKKPVGHRLARLALSNDYGINLVANGPIFSYAEQETSFIKVIFKSAQFHQKNSASSALTLLDNSTKLNGFEIAAADGVFIAADAEIRNEHIIVSHQSISIPAMVRYGWFDDPMNKANLGNKAGLPAAPFNSQSISLSSIKVKGH